MVSRALIGKLGAFDRRLVITGALATAAVGTGINFALAQSSGAVRVTDFRSRGDRDDSEAFRRALAAGETVLVPAGMGLGRGGAYLVREVALPMGATIVGESRDGTVIMAPNERGAVPFFADSGRADASVRGLRLSNLTLRGRSSEAGFAEHNHLLSLNGVEDVVLENLLFSGFQGDGLYLGSGRQGGAERHNRNVRVLSCVFDGVNNANRNAISILDGSAVEISGCQFVRCTSPTMPGAIDVEPDHSFAAVRDIAVRNCAFQQVGGNVGVIAILLPVNLQSSAAGIVIESNRFLDTRGTGATVTVRIPGRPQAYTSGTSVRIERNIAERSIGAPMMLHEGNNFAAVGNTWTDYNRAAWIGGERDERASSVRLSDTFVRCGKTEDAALLITNASGLDLSGTTLIDCGKGGPQSAAILFGYGRSDNVTLSEVTVSSPQGRTRVAIAVSPAHALSRRTNRMVANRFSGLPAASIMS